VPRIALGRLRYAGDALAACTVAFCLLASAEDAPLVTDKVVAPAPTNEPYPVDFFAMRAVVSNVSASPDGKHLALMKIQTRDGNPIIEVYDAADLDKVPFRMDAKPMEVEFFSWVSDRDILFRARQQVRKRIEGFNQGVYEYKWGMLDVERKKVRSFSADRAQIVGVLPNKPNNVILALAEGGGDGLGAKLRSAFWPLAYYELDLRRGTKKLLIRGKISLGQIEFDSDENPRRGRGFDDGSDEHPRRRSGLESLGSVRPPTPTQRAGLQMLIAS